MSIGLEIEKEIETETTQNVRLQPSMIENRTRLLLMKRDNPVQGTKDLARMMALFDTNGS
jgi:hypothetical protein